MWKKIAIAGAVGAAILGTGVAALAETTGSSLASNLIASSATPTATTSTTASTGAGSSSTGAGSGSNGAGGAAGTGVRARRLRLVLGQLRQLEHGEWVTHGQNGDVTHDAATGLVTAVSPTSITVQATDGFSETFVVTSTTKVHVKGATKAISAVAVNDRVLVAGVKDGSTVTANQILDVGPKK